MDDDDSPSPTPLIAVVGPCASGKSTLVDTLRQAGFRAKHPTQEHSGIANMWQRLTNPDVLIFLDASHTAVCERRKQLDGSLWRWEQQHRRLAHARANCHFYLDTTELSIGEVKTAVLTFLQQFFTADIH